MSDAADLPAGTGAATAVGTGDMAATAGLASPPVHQAERPVAVAVAALEEAERALAAVDRALEALDRGTYGRCAVCEVAIAESDLAGDPTLTSCGEHRNPV